MSLENMINKAIIPAAGDSTRLPYKLIRSFYRNGPLMIDYGIKELKESGIDEIQAIVSPPQKNLLTPVDETYHQILREHLKEQEVSLGYQEIPKGLGHAIGKGEGFADEDPVLVLLPDDITIPNASKEMVELFNKYNSSIIGCSKLDEEDFSEEKLKDGKIPYGVVVPEKEVEEGVYLVKSLEEKPAPKDVDLSNGIFKISGRYAFVNKIFDCIRKTPKGAEGEIQITDAIKLLNESEDVYLFDYTSKGIKRYDAGNPAGFEETRKAVKGL